jgi:hypothetical protein
VIEFEFPWFGKLKTQSPVLAIVLPDVNYRALFSVDRHIESDSAFDLQQRKLADFPYTGSSKSATRVTPQKEVSDAELERLGIN